MASVLHRTTKEYRRSANTPDFPGTDWIINPDMSAVVGFPSQYWIITGDTVTLMDQAARDAVDAAAEEARVSANEADALDAVLENRDERSIVIRALGLVMLDEINVLRVREGLQERTKAQLTTALRTKIQAGEGRA